MDLKESVIKRMEEKVYARKRMHYNGNARK
jgi:hypothetical protein